MTPIFAPSPIPPDRIGPPAAIEFVPRIKRVIEAKQDKLVLLATEYGLDIEALNSKLYSRHAEFWRQLAERLAADFVPGFRVVEQKSGRKRGSGQDPGPLYDAVSALVSDGKSIAEACRMLRRRKGPWRGKKAEALETQYHREKARRRDLARLLDRGTDRAD